MLECDIGGSLGMLETFYDLLGGWNEDGDSSCYGDGEDDNKESEVRPW